MEGGRERELFAQDPFGREGALAGRRCGGGGSDEGAWRWQEQAPRSGFLSMLSAPVASVTSSCTSSGSFEAL
eukprot:5889857-Pleurochrysis_carterae.AAC.1